MKQARGRAPGAGMAALVLATACAGVAAAQGAVAHHMTPSREYDQERLGSIGLAKCKAYKAVRRHSDEMQAADHGMLSPGDTRRLMAELTAAKHRPPVKLTPGDCGVPL